MVLSPLYNFSLAIPILTIGRPATLGSWVPWDFDSKHSSGAILSFIHINYNLVGTIAGLPRWSTGKESACRCRRGRRDGRSVGQEDSLEEEMATHSSTLAWRIPWTEKPGRLQSIGSQRVGQEWRDLARTYGITYCLYSGTVNMDHRLLSPRSVNVCIMDIYLACPASLLVWYHNFSFPILNP